jgi:hypothetical protein
MDEKELYEMACVKECCPKCNGKTRQTEKETFSGQEMREYQCRACGWTHVFEHGPALWTVFSNANDESRSSPGVAAAPAHLPPQASGVPGRTIVERIRSTAARCWRRLRGR